MNRVSFILNFYFDHQTWWPVCHYLSCLNLRKKEEPPEKILELPEDRFQFIADFLQSKSSFTDKECSGTSQSTLRLHYCNHFYLLGECRYLASQGTLVNWDNLVHGINLEVELSKVCYAHKKIICDVSLLCNCVLKCLTFPVVFLGCFVAAVPGFYERLSKSQCSGV